MDCYCLEYDKRIKICRDCGCGGNKKAHGAPVDYGSLLRCVYNCSRFQYKKDKYGRLIRNVRCGTKFELLMSMGLKNE